MTKPEGHVSHIFNAGTDNSVLEAAQAAHAAGNGPSVGTTLVQANGEQLQEVGAGWEGAAPHGVGWDALLDEGLQAQASWH